MPQANVSMNLDDLTYFHTVDSHNVLAQIDGLPDQVANAWALGQALAWPDSFRSVTQVVITGMGSSAMGGALTQALTAPECSLPVSLIRDYALPAFVGPHSLVIGLSHSGETEETLSACQQALERGAKLLAITTGGQLAALAEQQGETVWRFEQPGTPRTAVGLSFMLSLSALVKLGVVKDKSRDVAEAVGAVRVQQAALRADSPVTRNPAKRMAGQLMGRLSAIVASDYLVPVARRWNDQLAQVSKAWAQFAELPEMDHNQVVGTLYPAELVSKFMVLFLRSAYDHPRNRRRAQVTREIYMTSGFNTDEIEAQGQSPLAHMLTALHYGDYVAYYLAMAYGVDPYLIPQIDYVKEQLAQS